MEVCRSHLRHRPRRSVLDCFRLLGGLRKHEVPPDAHEVLRKPRFHLPRSLCDRLVISPVLSNQHV